MTQNPTHTSPSVDPAKEDSIFLRGVLRALGYNTREITRLLEDVDAHAELMGLLEKVATLVETIGAERRLYSQTHSASREPSVPGDETVKIGKQKIPLTECVGSTIPSETVDYHMLKRATYPYRRDFPRFYRELMLISHKYSSLPQTLHAWIIWSGKWEELLQQISGYPEDYFVGDEALIQRTLHSRMDALRRDPENLTKNLCTVTLSSGRTITLSNIYDFYTRLGQGGVQVIDAISYGIEKNIPKLSVSEPISKPWDMHPKNPLDARKDTPTPSIKPPSWTGEVMNHVGYGSDENHQNGSPHPKVLSVMQIINDSLRSSGSDFSCTSGDLVLTGFGMIILSATVSGEKKMVFGDFFHENGKYRGDTIL